MQVLVHEKFRQYPSRSLAIACFDCHNDIVEQRRKWRVEQGTVEEIEGRRLEKWRTMSGNDRLKELDALRRAVLGDDAGRLERCYRFVEIPRR